jgi:hypothetical protein
VAQNRGGGRPIANTPADTLTGPDDPYADFNRKYGITPQPQTPPTQPAPRPAKTAAPSDPYADFNKKYGVTVPPSQVSSPKKPRRSGLQEIEDLIGRTVSSVKTTLAQPAVVPRPGEAQTGTPEQLGRVLTAPITGWGIAKEGQAEQDPVTGKARFLHAGELTDEYRTALDRLTNIVGPLAMPTIGGEAAAEIIVRRGGQLLTGIAKRFGLNPRQVAQDAAQHVAQAPSARPSVPGAGIPPAPVRPAPVAGSRLSQGLREQAAADIAQQAARKAAQAGQVQSTVLRTQETAAQAVAAQAAKAAHPPVQVKIPLSPKLLQTLNSEKGAVNVKPIQDYLEHQHNVQTFSGDLGDKLFQIKSQDDVAAIEVRQLIRTLDKGATPQDWEAVYHAREAQDPSRLGPHQRSLFNVTSAVMDETERVKQSLPTTFRPVTGIGYVRRFPIGTGSLVDRVLSTPTGGYGGSILRRTTSAFKHREFAALTNTATGGKQVVRIAGGRVIGADGTFLGTMARLKSKEELLVQDIAPFQRQIDALTRQIKTLQGLSFRTPGRVSAVTNALGKKLLGLDDQLADTVTWANPKMITDLTRERQEVQRMLDVFREARTTDPAAVDARIRSLTDRVTTLQRSVHRVQAEYDPGTLAGRIFVGKDGTRYRLGQATTREIEAQTGTRYYKNALASAMIDHSETMQIARAHAFLEHLKTDPDAQKFMAPREQGWQHSGWVTPRLETFQNYVMEPRVAAELNVIAGRMADRSHASILKGLQTINRYLVGVGFFNPLIHVPNVAINWTADRGTLRYLNPASYVRWGQSTVKAWNAAMHINRDYTDVMFHGGGVMRERGAAADVRDSILDMVRREMRENPSVLEGLATQLGRTTKDIINSPYWLSHHITWAFNDLAYLQRVFEREAEGMTRQQAIAETDRFIPNYRIPGAVAPLAGLGPKSETVGSVLRGKALIFMPYHYGVLKAIGQSVKGLVMGPTVRDRIEAADKMAAVAILLTVAAPAMDSVFRWMTGDKHAQARRPGVLAPISNTLKVARGDLPIDYALESAFTPSPLVSGGLNVIQQRSRWTDPSKSAVENVLEGLKVGGGGMLPLSVRGMAQQGQSFGKMFLSPVMSEPKYTPAERNLQTWMFQSRPRLEASVIALQTQGKDDAAQAKAHAYNERLRALLTQAAREEGEPEDVIPGLVDDVVNGVPGRSGLGIRLGMPGAVEQKTERKQIPFSVRDLTTPKPRQRTYQLGPPP